MTHGTAALADGCVDVWARCLEARPETVEHAASVLSRAERDRAERYVRIDDARRFLRRRALLRRILGSYLGCDPSDVAIEVEAAGRPRLTEPEADGLRFSLAHSGHVVVVAVARNREVGVDIERQRSDVDADDLVCRYFAPAEVADYVSTPQALRTLAFFAGWTRKEAYLKAIGTGLLTPLDSFTVSMRPTCSRTGVKIEGGESNHSIFDLGLAPEYSAALAVEGPCGPVRCRRWTG